MNSIKSIVVSVVVAVVLAVIIAVPIARHFSTSPASTPTENVGGASFGGGGNVTGNIDSYTNGVMFGGNLVNRWVTGTLGAGQNQGNWRNTTGRVVYADLGEFSTVGTSSTALTATASSSFEFFFATSTTATLASDYTNPFGNLLNGSVIATSSPATTTSSLDFARLGYKVIPIQSNEYLIFTMQQLSASGCSIGGACEPATSTNRGFNVDWRARLHYRP